jgi:hypothetical protein
MPVKSSVLQQQATTDSLSPPNHDISFHLWLIVSVIIVFNRVVNPVDAIYGIIKEIACDSSSVK